MTHGWDVLKACGWFLCYLKWWMIRTAVAASAVAFALIHCINNLKFVRINLQCVCLTYAFKMELCFAASAVCHSLTLSTLTEWTSSDTLFIAIMLSPVQLLVAALYETIFNLSADRVGKGNYFSIEFICDIFDCNFNPFCGCMKCIHIPIANNSVSFVSCIVWYFAH